MQLQQLLTRARLMFGRGILVIQNNYKVLLSRYLLTDLGKLKGTDRNSTFFSVLIRFINLQMIVSSLLIFKAFKIRNTSEHCLQPGFIHVNSFFTNLNLKLQNLFYRILHSTNWANLQKINIKIKKSSILCLDRKIIQACFTEI